MSPVPTWSAISSKRITLSTRLSSQLSSLETSSTTCFPLTRRHQSCWHVLFAGRWLGQWHSQRVSIYSFLLTSIVIMLWSLYLSPLATNFCHCLIFNFKSAVMQNHFYALLLIQVLNRKCCTLVRCMILGDMYSCLDFQNCLSTIISDVYIPSAKKFIQDYIYC